MFERSDRPRVFALPPGVDFTQVLVDGLAQRLYGKPPGAWSQVEIIVNTLRMKRRLIRVLASRGPGLMPRVHVLTEVASPLDMVGLPAVEPGLRRRLELVQLVSRLLESQPDLAPRSALFDLADSLATLMAEMQIEGVAPTTLAKLDVTDQSGHWRRAQKVLDILRPYFEEVSKAPDEHAMQRLAINRVIERWRKTPPSHPVIIAGSTASRGTTRELIEAVARLPQGAMILPGFDFDMPRSVWTQMTDALVNEDHPQFRFARLMHDLELGPDQILPWVAGVKGPSPARNQVISLALRPAPVTGQWLSEGPRLPDLPQAMSGVTLMEAQSPRDEAQAIALRLRRAADEGFTAALITPDRMLTRRVSAALDKWGIRPDDSAGQPAHLSPPGRFLRHVAALFSQELTAEALLTLLKHPLTHAGEGRRQHNLNTRDLELHIRRKGWPFPQAQDILDWAAARDKADWAAWVARVFYVPRDAEVRPLGDWLEQHIATAEAISAGALSDRADALWAGDAGQEVRKHVTALRTHADAGGAMSVRDYGDLFGAVLSREEVRDHVTRHPRILIWGTLEARVMGAELMILGGLNEGSWPEMPGADPWLNRKMRHEAGLLLPERKIGLSAHDFQQAACASEVWLTRSVRSEDAETVPSRWINRLTNLMRGLPMRQGPEALAQMRARGDIWLAQARAAEAPILAAPALRPAPVPPVAARPRKLSVTEIRHLIRDPFAIYAKHVLRLRPLDPLQRAPDYMMRGTVLHDVMERFVKASLADPDALTPGVLTATAREVLAEKVPWPATREAWSARVARVAEWFVANELELRQTDRPTHFEISGAADLPLLGFTLTGKADRIDMRDDGSAVIYDYKAGSVPSTDQIKNFDKQLLLEAAMVMQGGFKELSPRFVAAVRYIALGTKPKMQNAPLEEMPPDVVWAQFGQLIAHMLDARSGFPARNAVFKEQDASDYDQLARFGEWDGSHKPVREMLK